MLNRGPLRHSAGVSLIELMIGIAIGLFVLVGLSAVYVNSVYGGRTTTSSNQLNQELRALMDVMVNDLRRAGHMHGANAGDTNLFTSATTMPVISNSGKCILYSYDATYPDASQGGAVTAGIDFAGFRLNDAGVVQAVKSTTLADTTTSCDQVAWVNLTDDVSTVVTELTFDTEGSQCVAVNLDAPDPDDRFINWTKASGVNLPACDENAVPSGTAFPDPDVYQFVETRRINIRLAGYSTVLEGNKKLVDPTTAKYRLRLEETVLIRSNRMIPVAAP